MNLGLVEVAGRLQEHFHTVFAGLRIDLYHRLIPKGPSTQQSYNYNDYYPIPKYLIIGYLDP